MLGEHTDYSAGFVLGPTESSEYLSLKRGKCESCPFGPIRRSDGISPEGSTPLDLGAELSAPGRILTPQLPPLQGDPREWRALQCRSFSNLMARGQSPLARAQARALRALSADTPPPAASPETSVSVMAPPAASPGADGGSPSRPPLAGVTEVSAPSSLPTASTGDARGEGSESSVAQPDDALSPVLGAVPCSASDAPEAASSAGSADSQPQGSVSGSGAPGDGACSAADALEASSAGPGAPRFSSVRWEDIEEIVTAGTDRTVRQVQKSAQSHFLALARLVVNLNRRPPLRTDYELDQRLEAAGSLSDVVDALAPIPRSLAPWEYELTELRGDVASLEARAPKLLRSSSSGAVASTSFWRTRTKSSTKTRMPPVHAADLCANHRSLLMAGYESTRKALGASVSRLWVTEVEAQGSSATTTKPRGGRRWRQVGAGCGRPLPLATDGNRYVVAAVDYASRYMVTSVIDRVLRELADEEAAAENLELRSD
ncbi:unnamed protein product [Phytophthora fragariaefolia]|uniref:Unnamed protein product n=1 Tax=Phytophthora fragariaefolia TaxID=1490495 RepID=A0A9W7CPQ1_9STRA|nr:unnamed protein product [Phytophthora fragariaefolia]